MKQTQLKALPPEPLEDKPLHLKSISEIIGREYSKPNLRKPHFPAAKPEPVSHGQMGEILRGLTKKRKVTATSAIPAWDKVLGWMKGGVK